jgi:hypothetical protein
MPEAGGNYVNASLMLPHGNSLARGTVIGQKRDARGDPIGNANTNPIMDSRVYRVEFDDGNVCELTANVIAESMYASCDADGNEYILFDSFVDYKSNSKAVTKDNRLQLTSPIHCWMAFVCPVEGWINLLAIPQGFKRSISRCHH